MTFYCKKKSSKDSWNRIGYLIQKHEEIFKKENIK